MTDKYKNIDKNPEKLDFSDLWDVVKALRAPDGCPWDRVQTHESLEKPMIEEAYETVDAIEKGDNQKLCEELGDVLLQVIFHTQIAESEGAFTFGDVTDREARKMIGRHPFLFEDGLVLDVEPDGSWEKNKLKEKGISSLKADISDIPDGYPAITRAIKISSKIRRAQKAGDKTADGLDIGVIPEKTDTPETEEDVGKLLYAVCAESWSRGIDPERALRRYADSVAAKQRAKADAEGVKDENR